MVYFKKCKLIMKLKFPIVVVNWLMLLSSNEYTVMTLKLWAKLNQKNLLYIIFR